MRSAPPNGRTNPARKRSVVAAAARTNATTRTPRGSDAPSGPCDIKSPVSHRRRAERQQRDVARALDRRSELPLVLGAVAGDAVRDQLAALGDEVAEQPNVLVIDRYPLGTEAANLPPLHAAAK